MWPVCSSRASKSVFYVGNFNSLLLVLRHKSAESNGYFETSHRIEAERKLVCLAVNAGELADSLKRSLL